MYRYYEQQTHKALCLSSQHQHMDIPSGFPATLWSFLSFLLFFILLFLLGATECKQGFKASFVHLFIFLPFFILLFILGITKRKWDFKASFVCLFFFLFICRKCFEWDAWMLPLPISIYVLSKYQVLFNQIPTSFSNFFHFMRWHVKLIVLKS